MFLLKLFSQFVNGFPDNLNIIDSCMKSQPIFFQLLLADVFTILLHACYGSEDVIQTGQVSFRLSHILALYLGLLFSPQKVTGRLR